MCVGSEGRGLLSINLSAVLPNCSTCRSLLCFRPCDSGRVVAPSHCSLNASRWKKEEKKSLNVSTLQVMKRFIYLFILKKTDHFRRTHLAVAQCWSCSVSLDQGCRRQQAPLVNVHCCYYSGQTVGNFYMVAKTVSLSRWRKNNVEQRSIVDEGHLTPHAFLCLLMLLIKP